MIYKVLRSFLNDFNYVGSICNDKSNLFVGRSTQIFYIIRRKLSGQFFLSGNIILSGFNSSSSSSCIWAESCNLQSNQEHRAQNSINYLFQLCCWKWGECPSVFWCTVSKLPIVSILHHRYHFLSRRHFTIVYCSDFRFHKDISEAQNLVDSTQLIKSKIWAITMCKSSGRTEGPEFNQARANEFSLVEGSMSF